MSGPRFWMDVYNAAGERQGDGFISTIESLTVKRVLDGVGSFSISLPETDTDVTDLVVDEARVRIYILIGDEDSADYEKRLMVSGIVRKRSSSETATGGWTMTCSGDDELDELTRENVMLGLEYSPSTHSPEGENWTVLEIIANLLSLAPSWSASVDAVGTLTEMYARFDGMNLIEVLIEMSKQKGIHFRASNFAHDLDVGAFGEWNGLSLVQAERSNPDVYSNDDIGFIESIRITSDTSNVWNEVYPFTAGDGETRLDLLPVLALRGTAFGDPYDIVTRVQNGKTFYGLRDTASQALYGVINRGPALYDQIQIQSGNSAADIEAAADALYDIAAVDLGRHSIKLETFDVTAVKLTQNVRVGDKIHMTYKGRVERELADGTITYLPSRNINALFWVMAVTETINSSGLTTKLSISTIDRVELDDTEIIVGEIKRAQVERLAIKAYTSNYVYNDKGELDPTHPVIVQLELTTRVLRVRQVKLRLISDPFRTTSQGGAAGGNHSHVMFERFAAGSDIAADEIYEVGGDLGGPTTLINLAIAGTPPQTLSTYGSSGNHTHDPVYGIEDDTTYPEDITIDVDGTDATDRLANRGTTSTGIDEEIDITDLIADSPLGLQALHEITIGCEGGQGLVKAVISVYEDIQNLG
jgi:hypothetical protein